ncbi:MAG: hypothetical protein ABF572_04625 [Gluconobacter sp.]|uniref:hypothetical protein n=1 Tax=Gluconobacter sp. TaxID=1876758 RepID=UPI0039EAC33B
MSCIAIAASISSIASAVAAWKSSYASRDSADAARNGILLSQRPYIDAIGPSEFPLSAARGENNFAVIIKNQGNSIAIAHKVEIAAIPLNKYQEESSFFKWGHEENINGSDVFKDDPLNYTVNMVLPKYENLNSIQGAQIEVALNVTYSDVIGDTLHKRVCWIYKVSGAVLKKARNCKFYNDTY